MPLDSHHASTDFIHSLSLDSDDSESDDASRTSSPCKLAKHSQVYRQSAFSDASSRINSLNSYCFSRALKHAGRSSSHSQDKHPSLLLDLKQPSLNFDLPYSPLRSPAESVRSLDSIASGDTFASLNSELDSDLTTELEFDQEEGDSTHVDHYSIVGSEDERRDEISEAPLSHFPSRLYPLGHRANRSVLGIPYSQHNKVNQSLKPAQSADRHADEFALNPSTGARTRTSFSKSMWMPPTKVRRTQSMFATPEQMLHEQQLGNTDNSPAGEPGIQGISYIKSPDCPIPTFNVRQDPFPRITHQTLCRIIDGEFTSVFPEIIVIDCRFEYEYEGGHIDGAINVNSKQQLEEALFGKLAAPHVPGSRLLIFHCEYSAYRSPLMASHLRTCDRNLNAANYPNLYYPNVLVLDGGYSRFYNAASHRCVPQNYVEMNHALHQNTCQKEMSRFRDGMKARKFQSFSSVSTSDLSDFRFPEPAKAVHSASLGDLISPSIELAGQDPKARGPEPLFGRRLFGL